MKDVLIDAEESVNIKDDTIFCYLLSSQTTKKTKKYL